MTGNGRSSPDLTFELKSGGSVLVPVRRFTRKAFQFEYLCCMPAGQIRTTNQQPLPAALPRSSNVERRLLTFGRYKGFAAGGAPSHRVHLRDAEVAPEVFAVVTIKAFIPQQSLEAWTAQNTHRNCSHTHTRRTR